MSRKFLKDALKDWPFGRHWEITECYSLIIDYDYDFVGFSDYRGGYNETFYDEYYRAYDGDYLGQRPGRQNSVGF